MPAPRPASTVVLLRPSAARFEVFLVRRHAGIAFMGGAHVFPGGRVEDADAAPDLEMRHRLAAARELREEAGVVLGVEALTPFARWVTPEREPKRYDTWFFVAAMPPDQQCVHDGLEAVDSVWVDPADALALGAAREIALPPPTWVTLETLAGFRDAAAVLAWARRVPIVAIQPVLEERDGLKTLTMPGGRFVLEDRRWRPA